MFLWCAYCQKYQGEIEPYDDHQITHGICKTCRERKVMFDEAAIENARQIRDLFYELTKSVQQKNFPYIQTQYARLRSLHVSNTDIFNGIYQPLLYELGRLWESKNVPVAEENAVTTAIEELVVLGFKEIPNVEKVRWSSKPAVLITATTENRHILGMRLIEHWLCESGIPNMVIAPGLASAEILEVTLKLQPKVVVLSANRPSAELNRVLGELVRQAPFAQVILGGRFARNSQTSEVVDGVLICKNTEDLCEVLVRYKIMRPVIGAR